MIMKKDIETFHKLWNKFGDIPTDQDELIEEPFLHFETGTDRFDIWHWFEVYFDVTLGDVIFNV